MFKSQALLLTVGLLSAYWCAATAAQEISAEELSAAVEARLQQWQHPGNVPGGPGGAAQGPVEGCGVEGSGDCFVNNGSPFCEDANCCALVCAFDPFCCAFDPFPNGTWDAICVSEAEKLCNCDPKLDTPPHDTCANAIPVGLGAFPLDNTCASADGPVHDTCNDLFLSGLGLDVWYTHEAEFSGTLLISTCGLIDYDSWIAVYEGCDCEALSDPPQACNNDNAGCSMGSSRVLTEVEEGTCYTIRVGSSFSNPVGSGHLLIGPDPSDCEFSDGIPPTALSEGESCGANTNGGCLAPGPIDCCNPHGSPGCSDGVCESAVCSANPLCCDEEWGSDCAILAHDLCGSCAIAAVGLQCQDIYHGRAWAVSGNKDTDWYEINVTKETNLVVTINSEFLSETGIFETDPAGAGECAALTGNADPLVLVPACVTAELETTVGPGVYWLFVRPKANNNLPCTGPAGANDYFIHLACPPDCPADFTGNGVVNAADLAVFLGAWGPNPGSPADFNGNGVVNASDLAIFLGAWGPC